MSKNGIKGCPRKRYKCLGRSCVRPSGIDNHLERNFTALESERKCSGLMNLDTEIGCNLPPQEEVFNDKTKKIVLAAVQT